MGSAVVTVRAPQRSMMRAVQQPLYDTEVYAVAGALNTSFFSNQIGTLPLGWVNPKTIGHTNLVQSGQIGSPSRFYLEGFQFQISPIMSTPATCLAEVMDQCLIINPGIFRIGIGSIRDLLVCPAADIPSGVYPRLEGNNSDQTAGPVNQQHVFVGNGKPSVKQIYPFRMTTSKGARRYPIMAEENIAVTLEYPAGLSALTGGAIIHALRFVMQGIFFKSV